MATNAGSFNSSFTVSSGDAVDVNLSQNTRSVFVNVLAIDGYGMEGRLLTNGFFQVELTNTISGNSYLVEGTTNPISGAM